MPIYEYQCPKCEKVHEFVQKFSDAPMTACPDCQGPIEKIMSLSSFALKGSGWYTTDYKRKAETPKPAAASAPVAAAAPSAPAAAPSTTSASTKS